MKMNTISDDCVAISLNGMTGDDDMTAKLKNELVEMEPRCDAVTGNSILPVINQENGKLSKAKRQRTTSVANNKASIDNGVASGIAKTTRVRKSPRKSATVKATAISGEEIIGSVDAGIHQREARRSRSKRRKSLAGDDSLPKACKTQKSREYNYKDDENGYVEAASDDMLNDSLAKMKHLEEFMGANTVDERTNNKTTHKPNDLPSCLYTTELSTTTKRKYSFVCKFRNYDSEHRIFTECRRAFSEKHLLVSHIRGHLGDEPFKCDWLQCGKTFTSRKNLRIHMVYHTDDKKYVCKWAGCDKAYRTSTELCQHRRIHLNDKRFPCDWPGCGKKFFKSHQLKVHRYLHTGEKPYACHLCGHCFAQPAGLYNHKNAYHKNSDRTELLTTDELENISELTAQDIVHEGQLHSHHDHHHHQALPTSSFASLHHHQQSSGKVNHESEEMTVQSNLHHDGHHQISAIQDASVIHQQINSYPVDLRNDHQSNNEVINVHSIVTTPNVMLTNMIHPNLIMPHF